MADRERLIGIVQRLQDGDYSSEPEADALVAEFRSGVLDPHATDLIFWPAGKFDHEPTAAEIVEKALAYRPIAL